LVYFNPATGRYDIAETEPITLKMTPAAPSTAPAASGPPPALGMPIEEMTDILGLIPSSRVTIEPDPPLSRWWVHGVGASLALLLLLKALSLRMAHRFAKDPMQQARMANLKQLEDSKINDHEFLMASGRFIERWLGERQDPQLSAVLTDRDLGCFSGQEPAKVRIPGERRREILQVLRQSISLLLLALLFSAAALNSRTLAADITPDSATSTGAEQAYREARYDEAIRQWLSCAPYDQLSADTLYHIGNACYRAGSPGYATLYYRRALAREPGHVQSQQNLRFIERKYGSLSIQRPNYHYLLARLPLRHWHNIAWAGVWLTLLGLLVFPATRQTSLLRLAAVIALIFAPLIAIGGGIGIRYFPTDAVYSPIEQQAVIVAEQAALHTEASRNSTRVIDAPPGSLCQVLQVSGKWAYVAFATKTCGWVSTESIRMVVVKERPEMPRIKKPLADETNA
ncbi:MAG TPA: hypothetical protein VFY13_08830, partial [Luteolibacter sp.]|nr:hypothetical protein [Luteolibacter sp.]